MCVRVFVSDSVHSLTQSPHLKTNHQFEIIHDNENGNDVNFQFHIQSNHNRDIIIYNRSVKYENI